MGRLLQECDEKDTDKNQEKHRVTRAIEVALELIAEHDPELARLLSETIKTGEYLSYSPASQSTSRRKSQRAKKIEH
jgi:hypothetical protein